MRGFVNKWNGKKQKGLLERILPDKFEHLVQLNALNRPGPLSIKMDVEYEKRRFGSKYVAPKLLEKHLRDTYGLLLYQEQVINILADWLDINLGKADIMRKKMEGMTIKDMLNEGNYYQHLYQKYDKKDLEVAINFLQEAGGYSFNLSHSFSYSVLAFQMAYLKCYYRMYFDVAVLNTEDASDDKGKLKIKKTLADCYDHNWVKPYNLNEISYYFKIDGKYIVPGVKILKGVGLKSIEDVIRNKPYTSMADFLTRAKCNKNIMEALDSVGFFLNSFGSKLDKNIFLKAATTKKKVSSPSMFD
jgi:DNA polymerase-3 subunit alpha